MADRLPKPSDFRHCNECGQLHCVLDRRDFDRDREGRSLGVNVCFTCGRIVGSRLTNRMIDWVLRRRLRAAERRARGDLWHREMHDD